MTKQGATIIGYNDNATTTTIDNAIITTVDNDSATIDNTVTVSSEATVTNDTAEGNTSEDAYKDAYKEIINQQNSTIDALLERTNALSKQINELLRSGVQINDGGANDTQMDMLNHDLPGQMRMDENYVTLAELGKEFGKRD